MNNRNHLKEFGDWEAKDIYVTLTENIEVFLVLLKSKLWYCWVPYYWRETSESFIGAFWREFVATQGCKIYFKKNGLGWLWNLNKLF